jgi:hypothetical protein
VAYRSPRLVVVVQYFGGQHYNRCDARSHSYSAERDPSAQPFGTGDWRRPRVWIKDRKGWKQAGLSWDSRHPVSAEPSGMSTVFKGDFQPCLWAPNSCRPIELGLITFRTTGFFRLKLERCGSTFNSKRGVSRTIGGFQYTLRALVSGLGRVGRRGSTWAFPRPHVRFSPLNYGR